MRGVIDVPVEGLFDLPFPPSSIFFVTVSSTSSQPSSRSPLVAYASMAAGILDQQPKRLVTALTLCFPCSPYSTIVGAFPIFRTTAAQSANKVFVSYLY